MTHQNVVVGVDGSLVAVRALDQAADEAVRRAAGLHIVYAVADRDEAPPVLASAAARVRGRHPGLPVVISAVEGDAVETLVHEGAGAALTVVGTRGLGGITGRLAGSVSLRLAAQTRGPLLVVRDDCPRDRGTPAAERERGTHGGPPVLLGLEGDADADVAAYAFQEAERRRVALRVLHAAAHRHTTPEMPSPIPAAGPGRRHGDLDDRAEEAVPRFGVARLRERYPEISVDARTVRTSPARALVEATRESAVVVIGVHRRPGPLGRRLGPVAHTLLHRSHCPVLLVPVTG
ncbi:universal stress protein [Streptomyces hyaluromycini]|uniref:universal stress protein n=1 Tax=Streptomyces hyaluromycini TaxID=1377993 RepID=UPI001582469E|nr:universal stress protein [Streptomyces hyaluromycini]